MSDLESKLETVHYRSGMPRWKIAASVIAIAGYLLNPFSVTIRQPYSQKSTTIQTQQSAYAQEIPPLTSILQQKDLSTGELDVADDITYGLVDDGGFLLDVQPLSNGGAIGLVRKDTLVESGENSTWYYNQTPALGLGSRVNVDETFKSYLGTDTIPAKFKVINIGTDTLAAIISGSSQTKLLKLTGNEFTSVVDFSGSENVTDSVGNEITTETLVEKLAMNPVGYMSIIRDGKNYFLVGKYDGTWTRFDITNTLNAQDFFDNTPAGVSGFYPDVMFFSPNYSSKKSFSSNVSIMYATTIPRVAAINDPYAESLVKLANQDIALNEKIYGLICKWKYNIIPLDVDASIPMDMVTQAGDEGYKKLGLQYVVIPKGESKDLMPGIYVQVDEDIPGGGGVVYEVDEKNMAIAGGVWIHPDSLYKLSTYLEEMPGHAGIPVFIDGTNPEFWSVTNGSSVITLDDIMLSDLLQKLTAGSINDGVFTDNSAISNFLAQYQKKITFDAPINQQILALVYNKNPAGLYVPANSQLIHVPNKLQLRH